MFTYDASLRNRIFEVSDAVRRFAALYSSTHDTLLLSAEAKRLRQTVVATLAVVKTPIDTGNFGRHLHFIEYYLERADKAACASDVEDLLENDLPRMTKSLNKWVRSQVDAELLTATETLIASYDLDSAVRKAFLILTDRLRQTGGDPELDGHKLVTQVLAATGPLGSKLDEKARTALQKLLDGLYGVFRNKYGHAPVSADFAEAHAVLWMINWALLRIGEIEEPVPSAA